MKINIDGRNYSFKFYHENPPTHTTRLNKVGEEIPVRILPAPERATTCIVFNKAGEEVTRGTANVHPEDNFCKEKGRQLAIKRAVFNWDESYKTLVWENYRTWGTVRWGNSSDLPDYQVRVIEEKTELDAKISKLEPFLETDLYKSLPSIEQTDFLNMTPASKFWLLVLIGFLIMMGILVSPWIPIVLYIIYSIVVFLKFIEDIKPDTVTDEESDIIVRKPYYKYSLILGLILFISSFNKFINNKFKKND